MLKLISCLGLTRKQAAREAVARYSAVHHWLQGTQTACPSALAAGEAMLDWYETTHHWAPAHDLAEHDTASDEASEGAEELNESELSTSDARGLSGASMNDGSLRVPIKSAPLCREEVLQRHYRPHLLAVAAASEPHPPVLSSGAGREARAHGSCNRPSQIAASAGFTLRLRLAKLYV